MATTLQELVLLISGRDEASPALAAVRANTQSFAAAVSERLTDLASNYRVLGQSENEAAISAERLRGAVESAVTAEAQANIQHLAPAAKESGGAFGFLGEQLGSVAAIAKGMVLGQVALSLTQGVAENIKAAVEGFDKLGLAVAKVQRLTTSTAEDSSLLLGILTRYGMPVESATTAILKMNRSIAGLEDPLDIVAAGGKSGVQQLKQLGIEMTDASGKLRTDNDIFTQVVGAIQGKPGPEQTAIIQNVFKIRGDEASQLQRVMMDGQASVQEYFNELRTTGHTLTQEQIDDVLTLEDAHRKLDRELSGMSLQLVGAVAPAFTTLARAVALLAQGFNSLVIPAMHAVGDAANFISDRLREVGITGLAAVAVITAPINLLAQPLVMVGLVVKGLRDIWETNFLGIGSTTQGVIGFVVDKISGVADLLANLHLIPADWREQWKSTTDAIGAGASAIPNAVGDAAAQVQAAWDKIGLHGSVDGPGMPGGNMAATETALEAQAKSKKNAADQLLKIAQDAAAQRKEEFDAGEVANQTATMTAKLAADEAGNNAQLLGYKQQIEDIDAHAIDFALKRQQIDESDAATVAKMAEAKLKAQSEDLSYQEKLLLAQARATRAAGGTVDMGALRQQVLAIREQQIQNEPGLLIAQHNSSVADRASQLTSAQQTLASNATERQKLAIQETMQPFTDAATNAKRIADSMQQQLDMDKLRFEIAAQAYQAQLITAQQTARAADAVYQAAVAAAQATNGGTNVQGGVGSAPYGPLANGVAGAVSAGSGATVTIVQQNTVSSPADEDRLAQKTADVTLQYLNAAATQQSNTRPAYHGLPGAFATSTP